MLPGQRFAVSLSDGLKLSTSLTNSGGPDGNFSNIFKFQQTSPVFGLRLLYSSPNLSFSDPYFVIICPLGSDSDLSLLFPC